MKGRIEILVLVSFLSLLIFPSVVLSQDNPDRNDVLLKATFRDGPGDAIRSENGQPYINGTDLHVYIRNPEGSLYFYFGERSGRRIVFRFPSEDRIRPPYDPENPGYIDISQYCLYYPESVNPPDTEFSEFAKDGCFKTYNGQGFVQPQINLLNMIPKQVARVAIWLGFCTYQRADFWLRVNASLCPKSGVSCLWVEAIDLHVSEQNPNGDGRVERWQLTPWNPTDPNDPYYLGYSNLHRYLPKRKGSRDICEFGDFFMPFVLWLDRIE